MSMQLSALGLEHFTQMVSHLRVLYALLIVGLQGNGGVIIYPVIDKQDGIVDR